MGAHSNLGVYSDAQEITASAASTSTVDHSMTVNQYGVSGDQWLCIRVAVAPTVAADSLSIMFQTDTDDGAGDPAGTWYTLFAPYTDADGDEYVASAEELGRALTAGAWIWRAPLPMEMTQRHTRLYYYNADASAGTQTIDAWINDGPPQSDMDKQIYVSPVGNP